MPLINKPLDKLVFADIETTSQYPTFASMPEDWQYQFKRRFKNDIATLESRLAIGEKLPAEAMEELYNNKAPLHPEFGQIVCISVGMLLKNNTEFKVKHYASTDERELLVDFLASMDEKVFQPKNDYSMVAHNGKSFDIPFLAKRILANSLILPNFLTFEGKKPWELTQHIDTKVVWQMNVYDSAASLEILCLMFGIPTSKDDMHGSEVKNVFWIEKDVERIAKYCDKDVVALARVYLHINGYYELSKQI